MRFMLTICKDIGFGVAAAVGRYPLQRKYITKRGLVSLMMYDLPGNS